MTTFLDLHAHTHTTMMWYITNGSVSELINVTSDCLCVCDLWKRGLWLVAWLRLSLLRTLKRSLFSVRELWSGLFFFSCSSSSISVSIGREILPLLCFGKLVPRSTCWRDSGWQFQGCVFSILWSFEMKWILSAEEKLLPILTKKQKLIKDPIWQKVSELPEGCPAPQLGTSCFCDPGRLFWSKYEYISINLRIRWL